VNSPAEAQLALQAASAAGLQAASRRGRRSRPRTSRSSCASGRAPTSGSARARRAGRGGERPLHHPCYDFNDDALPHGVRWFCAVAELALAP
jgi:hippurate hydrolase